MPRRQLRAYAAPVNRGANRQTRLQFVYSEAHFGKKAEARFTFFSTTACSISDLQLHTLPPRNMTSSSTTTPPPPGNMTSSGYQPLSPISYVPEWQDYTGRPCYRDNSIVSSVYLEDAPLATGEERDPLPYLDFDVTGNATSTVAELDDAIVEHVPLTVHYLLLHHNGPCGDPITKPWFGPLPPGREAVFSAIATALQTHVARDPTSIILGYLIGIEACQIPGFKPRLVGVEENPGPPRKQVRFATRRLLSIPDALRSTAFKYHGNWGGPGYGAGKYTSDPDFSVQSTDALDEVFKKHDYDYGKMDKGDADGLAVHRLKQLPLSTLTPKAQAAALGFHVMNGGTKDVREAPHEYPWEDNSGPKAKPQPRRLTAYAKPEVTGPRQAGLAIVPTAAPVAAPLQPGGEQKRGTPLVDPVVLTARGMAVETNPGPRTRKGSKHSRKATSKRPKSSRKKRASRKLKPRQQRKMAPPKQRAKTIRGSVSTSGAGTVFRRTDLIFSGKTSATAATGDVIFSCLINPTGEGNALVGNTRGINAAALNYEAAKWENFDCDVSFTVKTNGSDYVQGTFIMGIEMDTSDSIPSGTAGVARMTLQGAKVCSFSKGGTHGYSSINRTRAVKEYWCQPNGSDPRLTSKGLFVVMTDQPASIFNGATQAVGAVVPVQIYATYSFRFRNATLEPSTSLGSPGGLVCNPVATNPTATSPLGFAAGVPTILASSLTGLLIGNDGSSDYLGFLADTNWDLISKAFLGCAMGASAAAQITFATHGLTYSSIFSMTLGSTGTVTNGSVTLGNSVVKVSLNNAAILVQSGSGAFSWQQQLGTATFSTWGYLTLTATGTTGGSANGFFSLSPTGVYIPSITDKQLLQAGPGCEEYHLAKSWDASGPLEDHVKLERAKLQRNECDVKYLKQRLFDLQEMKTLGLGLGGQRHDQPSDGNISDDTEFLPPPLPMKSKIVVKGGDERKRTN